MITTLGRIYQADTSSDLPLYHLREKSTLSWASLDRSIRYADCSESSLTRRKEIFYSSPKGKQRYGQTEKCMPASNVPPILEQKGKITL